MITKINFSGVDFQAKFNKEDLKKLSSIYDIKPISGNYYIINKNGKVIELQVEHDENGNYLIYYKGKIFLAEVSKSLSENFVTNNTNVQKESVIKSPMPGLIAKIKVKEGDTVKKGDGLLTIEAMKMENEIKSPINGIVESIKVTEGTVVEKNAVLVVLQSKK